MELIRTIPLGMNTSSKVCYNINLHVGFDTETGILNLWCCRDNGRQCGHDQILTRGFSLLDPLRLRDVHHIHQIMYMWNQNHRRKGTSEQLRFAYQRRGFSHLRSALRDIGLLVDGGHEWGSIPLFEEVPDDVLVYLFNLPGHGNTINDIQTYLDKRVQGVDLDDLLKFLPA